MCVPSQKKTRFPVYRRLLVEERIANIGIPLDVFVFFVVSMIFCILKNFLGFGSLQTSLLCKLGELAGGGSVAVAVGISSYRGRVTQDT